MSQQRPRVLVVEDEAVTARDLAATLEELGYEVCGSERSGEAAVATACQEHPDLILMDIVLQGDMDGIEAGAFIQERIAAPVVFLTAYGDEERLQRAKASRPYGYVLKPYDDLTLKATLEMALNLAQVETRLRASEASLRGILDATFDAIILVELDGTIIDCNEALARRFERRREEFIGRDIYGYLEPEVAERRRRFVDHVLASGEPIRFEDERSGAVIDQTIYPVLDDQGRITRLAIYASDITERRRAELERRQSDALYRAIIEHATDAIFVADPDTGVILDVNPKAEVLMGFSRHELIGRHQTSLHPPEERERYRTLFVEAAQQGASKLSETEVARADGTRVPVEISSSGTLEVAGQRIHCGIFRDISERRRAEQELRDSELRFRTVADFTYDWEYWIGSDGSLFYISPSCERITGYTTEEFVNDPGLLERIVHPDDLPRVRSALFEKLQSRETLITEHRVAHRSGSVRWIGHISQPVFGERGEYLGRRASNRDITEQKHAEALLRESEELHRKTLSNISDAVLVTNQDGDLVFASGNLKGVFGLSESEVLELDNLRYLLGETILEHIDQVCRELRDLQIRITTGPSLKQVLLVNLHRVAIRGGSLLITCRDISEQAHAEAEEERLQTVVRSTASEWQATFDALTKAVLVFDAAGMLRRLNEYARSMLDCPFSKLVGRRMTRLGSHSPWPDVATAVEEVLRGERPAARLVTDSRTGISWEITTLGAALPGGLEAVICMVRDVSAELRLQERLRRSETMSALGSLVAGVAHEVRNPLFAISATIDAIEECHADLEELRPFHQGLRTQVERLQSVMSELLELGRPVDDTRHSCRLDRLAEEAVLLVRPLAERHGVTIEYRIDRPAAAVSVDLERITVACRNLLANACEHSPTGATVLLETATGDDQVRLLVRDHGTGFRDEDLPLVFTPFFSRRRGGVGLGLAIVARTVELHGGVVSAYNHDDGGAVVEIRLPRDRIPAEEQQRRGVDGAHAADRRR